MVYMFKIVLIFVTFCTVIYYNYNQIDVKQAKKKVTLHIIINNFIELVYLWAALTIEDMLPLNK